MIAVFKIDCFSQEVSHDWCSVWVQRRNVTVGAKADLINMQPNVLQFYKAY